MRRLLLGGTPVDLLTRADVLRAIEGCARGEGDAPLAVSSVNLDHIHHFGASAEWRAQFGGTGESGPGPRWLNLLDGMPLVRQARTLTGQNPEKLSGSDLIAPILAMAQAHGFRFGILGGRPETQERAREKIAEAYPGLVLAGLFAPSRGVLDDPDRSGFLAGDIRAAGVDILLVCLGKPRQEAWIQEHGRRSGARVLLAFGAVVDFLGGTVSRAPEWISRAGGEWLYRLALEPRRLARRYLGQGPAAYLALRSDSGLLTTLPAPPIESGPRRHRLSDIASGVDVAVVLVTYNSRRFLPHLLADLRESAGTVGTVGVVVVDNGSVDGTVEFVRGQDDVTLVVGHGNVGYGAGINLGLRHADRAGNVLVLNPDLRLTPGALATLVAAGGDPGVGAVVPQIVDETGRTFASLRREPAALRTTIDAFLGSKIPRTAAWSSETVAIGPAYGVAHEVDWATGAALLVPGAVARRVGPWEESYFLYSEETDYFRRIRDAGLVVRYRPDAVVMHAGAGSGSSPDLLALQAVNKIRYARAHLSAPGALAFRWASVLSELLRSSDPAHRHVRRVLTHPGLSSTLPRARPTRPPVTGAVVIPAHNEARGLARSLPALAELTAPGDGPATARCEVVVVCNGCTDDSAQVARGFPGVTVVESAVASKVAALNLGDATATRWPRLYLDADVRITPDAVRATFAALDAGALAARPGSVYDASAASWPVRRYYRARGRMPSLQTGLWGAGAYALSRAGRGRFVDFPVVTADDLFVDSLFTGGEKAVVDTTPVVVATPRTTASLLAVLRRVDRGNRELADRRDEREPVAAPTGRATLTSLVRTVRGPVTMLDAVVYAGFAIVSRLQNKRRPVAPTWERDHSSRA